MKATILNNFRTAAIKGMGEHNVEEIKTTKTHPMGEFGIWLGGTDRRLIYQVSAGIINFRDLPDFNDRMTLAEFQDYMKNYKAI